MQDLDKKFEKIIVPTQKKVLEQYTNNGTITLEIGCGPGQYRYIVKGSYVGIDISNKPYNEKYLRMIDIMANANALPFKPASFNLVFFSNTFYHFNNPFEMLEEAVYVLKPGGRLVIFDYSKPVHNYLDKLYSITCPGSRAYSKACREWNALFEESGIKNIKFKIGSQNSVVGLAEKYLPRGMLWFCIDHIRCNIYITGEKQ
jgi:ubiquinone/menaquinone biosynthesis C-methylase UbiE